MIAAPPGWTAERDEQGLVLLPAQGPADRIIRYVERLRPVRRARELVRAAGVPRGFVTDEVGAPRRLTTREGEPAALVLVAGRLEGRATLLSFGFVFLDDYYARVTGAAAVDARGRELAATVEALVISDTHALGRLRRRRYVYAPPLGWQGTGDLFDARWYPPDYPRNAARILVAAATPWTAGLAEASLARLAGGRAALAGLADARATLATRRGLVGERLQLRLTPDLETHVALLRDAAMFYAVRLDTPAAGAAVNLELLHDLVESIEPLAEAQAIQGAELDAAAQWAE
jgi:hypothetical protein